MTSSSVARRALASGLVGTAACAAYLGGLRPWQLRWGATDEEVARALPGDDIVARPSFNATRAVTVAARPADIWPWLVQMGLHRAGWYSYDWIDNLRQPSAERIIPELQEVQVGDFLPMSPDGKVGVWVKDFAPERWLLWEDKKGEMTWLWQLDPLDAQHTRLLSRVRGRYHWTSPGILFSLLVDVGDIIMMRKCLLGIKRRAEAGRQSTRSEIKRSPSRQV